MYSRRLQKWCNLRVSVNLLRNETAFSCSFSTIAAASAADVSPQVGGKGKTFTVSYLVESLGLTTKLAESISRKISFDDKGTPDSVLNLFRSHGFTESQISSIVTVYPRLLIFDAEKSLGPKLQFLQSRGASSSELAEILSKVPEILGKKGERTISRNYDFVKEIIEADKSSKFKQLCLSLPQGCLENKIRNVLVLRELGVPQRFLFPLFVSRGAYVCGKERFEESLKKVLEMGFDPTSAKFVEAMRVVYGLSDKTTEEKVDVYKRLGFAVDDVWAMFKKFPSSLTYSEKKITEKIEILKKHGLLEDEVLSVLKRSPSCIGFSEMRIKNSIETFLGLGFSRDEFVMMVKCFPQCLNLSAETLKKKIEFLVKKMKWPLKDVVSNPSVLGYSLEKRIVPRCSVIKALMSIRLLGRSDLPLMSSVLVCTDHVFLNRYVKKHNDKELVAELMAIFTC